jgi:hypothetical protein
MARERERERERERANLGSSSKWDSAGIWWMSAFGLQRQRLNGWKWRKADVARMSALGR